MLINCARALQNMGCVNFFYLKIDTFIYAYVINELENWICILMKSLFFLNYNLRWFCPLFTKLCLKASAQYLLNSKEIYLKNQPRYKARYQSQRKPEHEPGCEGDNRLSIRQPGQ